MNSFAKMRTPNHDRFFGRNVHPSLFGPTPPCIDAGKKDLLEERFTKRETDGKNEASVCKKRKTLLLHV